MAYFLPSYFQKRLLRYALSRLDFIETDELDLDNLGITWGQRSVIELKDVEIQIKKLTSLLNIPPSALITRARIALLRLTIPADLYASGIVVGIGGIDIQVRLQDLEGQKTKVHTQPRSSSGLSKGNRADRPRIGSPAIHDPGGTRRRRLRHGTVGDTGIPTSEDLALSFLESEPLEERKELQSIVHSQSQYLHESTTTTAGDGIGAPAGFELPSFVANFFKGVADRLSVVIKDVSLTVEIDLPRIGSEAVDTVKLMLKTSEIDLQSVDFGNDGLLANESRRSITVRNLEVIILSEPEVFSQMHTSSTNSSPRLNRAHTKMSSTSSKSMSTTSTSPQMPKSRLSGQQHISNTLSSLSQQSSQSSSSSTPAFASQTGLGVEDYTSDGYDDQSMEDSSLSFRPSMPLHEGSLLSQSTPSHVDNQNNARALAHRGELDPGASHPRAAIEHSQDLAESKLFSHDEAESMYRSALSHDMKNSRQPNRMPGAWDSSESEIGQPSAPNTPEFERRTPPAPRREPVEGSPEKPETPQPQQHDLPKGAIRSPDTPTKVSSDRERSAEPLVSKRILFISHVTVSIATSMNPEATEASEPQLRSQIQQRGSPRHGKSSSFADESMYSQFSSQMFATTQDVSQDRLSHGKTWSFDHDAARTRQASCPMLDIGQVSASFDLPIGKLFVRVWQEATPLLASLDTDDDPKPPGGPPSPLEAIIGQISVNIFEEVPELAHRSGPFDSPTSEGFDNLLLQACLSNIKLSNSSDGLNTLQRFTISKISVDHKNKSVMSFVDSFDVRSSMSASVLPPADDLVIVVYGNTSSRQTEIQTKSLKWKLDLVQIDEVLSRSGGLSSLLDLGNSIASTSTVRGGSPKVTVPEPRLRSVRFEPPRKHHSDEASMDESSAYKLNVRITGLSVELVGSDTAMHVRTSALKLVYRKHLFGMQIDWTEIEGPLLREQAKGDIKVRINNTRLEYLNSPKEADLERLLSILTPSSDKHDLENDDIMVDTLIRQRRKGGVLRVTLASLETTIHGLQWQKPVVKLVDELARLSSVSKYLPEDDRPGILTLALVKKVDVSFVLDPVIGTFSLRADLAEAAHVNVPSLMAAHITTLQIHRDRDCIIGDVVSSADPKLAMSPPMIMVRYIADEMEPTVRLKVFNLLLEYKISTVAALIELGTALQSAADESRPMSPASSVSSSSNAAMLRSRNRTRILLGIRDSALALNPLNSLAKGIVLLTDTTFTYTAGKSGDLSVGVDFKKLSMLVCDDASRSTTTLNADPKMFFDESLQVQKLIEAGFVPIAFLSAASIAVKVSSEKSSKDSTSEVELNNGLLILETCADSTQTMIQVLGGLSPPALPSKVEKYRIEIVPIQDMLASFTGNAYFTEPGPDAGLQAMPGIEETEDEDLPEGEPDFLNVPEELEDDDLEFIGQLWPSQTEAEHDEMSESYLDSELRRSNASATLSILPVAPTDDVMEASQDDVMAHTMLNFQEDHFARKEAVGGTAHRWDSKQGTYGLGSETVIQRSPLKVKVRDVHVIWHLFDGYDWQATRDSISKAVQDIEVKAAARRPRSSSRLSPRPEEEDESEIGDFLFNSIYIGIPANRDPRELSAAINRDIDDMTSETGSYATTTTVTASPTRGISGPRIRQKKLRLQRGKHHKMAFELKGISADFITFPPGSGEVESSVDVRVKDLEIIDQLPTSTWKKFATYMQDAGEREVNTSMVHIEILNVKPVADLAASEMVLKLSVLPLRLHVDQDAVDFMTRFFEFKDDRVPPSTTPSNPPFLQRVEVNPIRLKLDFKPKRVDYAGLRSGRTTEFMNFFVLDRADMVLRRVILYGVSGFDRMGIMLNNIWSPDVRRNQLPGVLAGLAPIRSLVGVGSGVRDLVVVPMREYKKDGRIVRSIQKGAIAFAKTTTKELVNLGAKLAIGTQTVLQDTEKMLGQTNEQERWEDQGEDEEKKQISLYADQPLGIVQGLRGAYASLERDLLLARDAIVAVPGEVMATNSATGAAQAVLRSAPTIILRPAIGASKAVGQTLLGAGNTLDRENYRRIQEVSTNIHRRSRIADNVLQKYKRH
jgi:autophagy-related protein 2